MNTVNYRKHHFLVPQQKLKVKILTVDVELEFESSAKTNCKELFVQVSKNLGMHEIWFFGLTYQDSNGDEIWIDNSKKVSINLSTC